MFWDAVQLASLGVLLYAMYIALASLELLKRWKLRRIPGEFAVPALGHLTHIVRKGSPMFIMASRKKYGNVFKMWFGRNPAVVVTDPELFRLVGVKNMNHPDFPMSVQTRKDHQYVDRMGLVAAKDSYWRTCRNAWQPIFSPHSLDGFVPLMNDSADKLIQQLERLAETGERVDVWRELGAMTLSVVGSTAFGVDFEAFDNGKAANSNFGPKLVEACKAMFEVMSISRGSKWGRLGMLIPETRPVIAWIASVYPDAPMKRNIWARQTIIDLSQTLIKGWKDSHTSEGLSSGSDVSPRSSDQEADSIQAQRSPMPLSDSKPVSKAKLLAKGSSATEQPSTALIEKPSPTTQSQAKGLISSGSFLGQLLAARDRSTGEGLNDLQLVGQCQTFILAGYETTANALAFALYNLATHPAAEQSLLAEVDAFGRDKAVTTDDLDKFPYVEAVFQETMRLYPPAHGTNRVLKEAMDLGGHHVPAGTVVIMSIWALHRSEEYWPQPDDFVPERFLPGHEQLAARVPNAHMPFGVGGRMCVGYKFAIQEAKIALVRLFQKFRFELEPGQVPLQLAYGITVSPKHGVWVKVVKRT